MGQTEMAIQKLLGEKFEEENEETKSRENKEGKLMERNKTIWRKLYM